MKRFVFIIIIILILTSCSRPYDFTHETFDDVVYQPSTPFFFETTLEGLESRAANIARAHVGNDARSVFQFPDAPDPTRPQRGHTLTSIEITQVIKGTLAVGDTITIVEPYYIFENVLHTRSHYLPSRPGQEYFFLLGNQLSEWAPEGYEGAYAVVNSERGRFPVPGSRANMQNYSRKDLSLGTRANLELYMRLWQEVVNAYM